MTEDADTPLRVELARLLDQVRPLFEHEALEERLGVLIKHAHPHFDEVSENLVSLFHQHPAVQQTPSRFFGDKQLGFYWAQIASKSLVKRALRSGPDDAINWIKKIAATNAADLRYVLEIRGLKLQEAIHLSNGVVICPWKDLPASANAKAISFKSQIRPGGAFDASNLPPVAAYLEIRNVKARLDLGDHFPSSEVTGVRAILERVARAFVLCGELAPFIGISWTDFCDSDLEDAEPGRQWMGPKGEINPATIYPKEVPTDAKEWIERLLALDEGLSATMDIALERLGLARLRGSPANRAIEGSICLEALLGDGGGDSLTHKISTRAAIVLSKTLEERTRTAKEVKDFYQLRSRAVHGLGTRRSGGDDHIARRGLEICAEVARRLVMLKRKMDPREWDLTGQFPLSDDE